MSGRSRLALQEGGRAGFVDEEIREFMSGKNRVSFVVRIRNIVAASVGRGRGREVAGVATVRSTFRADDVGVRGGGLGGER